MFDLASVHPLIVHAPLVLLPIAVLFAILSLVFPKAGLRLAAILLLAGGVAGAVMATETGEAAESHAEQVMPAVEDLTAPGVVPQAVAEGQLLETHAKLGELTRNLYGLLLLAECALLALSTPALTRLRRGWSLPARVEQWGRGIWTAVAIVGIAAVVLTGHYGGAMVYSHGVGVEQQAQASSRTP